MRWMLLICCALALAIPASAAVEIIDLPDTKQGEALDARYDLEWTVTAAKAPTGPLVLALESEYSLKLEKGQALWMRLAGKTVLPIATAALRPAADGVTHYTLKRREGVIALLQDHRLLFAAPATATGGEIAFRGVPGEMKISGARYRPVERRTFGDDFMRPEAALTQGRDLTTEDQVWKVAFYRKDFPLADPAKAKADSMQNPWRYSFFPLPNNTRDGLAGKPNYNNATNGFWYLYRGVGPSWVVPEPNSVYPTWDRYFVAASVKTEYQSAVGLIAAYQDNKNYLLFRWRANDAAAGPRGELIAMINGAPVTLDATSRGFDPGQWYRLRINLGWRTVQVLVDGEKLIEAVNPGVTEGRVGLYADGVANPKRPALDDVTAGMYATTDENTGKVTSEAQDALSGNSAIYFDDVKVGDWTALEDLFTSPYAADNPGGWTMSADGIAAPKNGGRLLSGRMDWGQYVAETRVMLPARGAATVYFHQSEKGNGYAWVLTPSAQHLYTTVNGNIKTDLASLSLPLKTGEWVPLRIEADGPYVSVYCDGTRVADAFDATRVAGRCGVSAAKNAASFRPFTITQLEKNRQRMTVHKGFEKNGWMATWSTPEADWYPAVNHGRVMRLPSEANPNAASDPGPAGPMMTDVPGLYWNKGCYYHDLRVAIPLEKAAFSGQMLHLSANYDGNAGYRLQGNAPATAGTGSVTLFRGADTVGTYSYQTPKKGRLIFERHGSFLLLVVQELDPDTDPGDNPEIISEQILFTYRDKKPLNAEQVGFTVTNAALPAAAVQVESDRMQETFETAPIGWTVGNGIWLVMQRYSCQPQWNFFGGFGRHTPHVWCKTRLDGDQNVEVYMGIKMQFDNQAEEYNRRYRDMNMSICTDGKDISSGYSVIRAGRPNNRNVTMLLRRGIVVASSTEQGHLLPPQGAGHRQWFATRIEKRGGLLKVFLDNKLAFTYTDPDPLPGGYVAYWTLDNGVLIGRTNMSAERMSTGSPKAFTPYHIPPEPAPLTEPTVAMNGVTVPVATFEASATGWRTPSSAGAVFIGRARVDDAKTGVNTVLHVINSYPAGDLSVSAPLGGASLAAQPVLHADYKLAPNTRINLYARVQDIWFEFVLTAKEAQEPNVLSAGRATVLADGKWRHLELNLADPIIAALKEAGKPTTDLKLQSLVFADWHPVSDVRWYGFGENPAFTVTQFDNVALLAPVATAVTLSWSGPDAATDRWRVAVDANPFTVPTTETTERTMTVQPTAGTRFLHVQAKTADGAWSPVVHVPITAKK
jgi:hypothetical protein